MKSFELRRTVSLALVLLAAVLTYTGIVLYIAPSGRVAHWSHWSFLGLDKEQLGAVHTINSFAFVILGWLHTWYNWKAILRYLKDKARRLRVATPEMVAATLLVALLVVGSALSWPPFAQVMELGEGVKDWWEEREGSPPWGHAELASLQLVASRLGLETDQALEALRSEGWSVDEPSAILRDIAHDHGRSPAELYAALEVAVVPAAGGEPAAPPPRAGLGTRSLAEHCEAEGIELSDALSTLAAQGVEAEPGSTLRELAGALALTPMELSSRLRGEGE
jgi:hypothetical protein